MDLSMSNAKDIVNGTSLVDAASQASMSQGDRNMSKVWFITGAGRGMGVDIAKAALAAGNKGF
jgi:hypothetical protein